MSGIIEKIYEDNIALLEFLENNQEISFKIDTESNFKKILLLSIASYFEHKITEILVNFIKNKTDQNEIIIAFTKSKAISRQYHSYFNWEANNANQFFGFFGEEFKKDIILEINDKNLKDAVKAFLELGYNRNLLVHQNYATFYIEKTTEELFSLYLEALKFIELLDNKFL